MGSSQSGLSSGGRFIGSITPLARSTCATIRMNWEDGSTAGTWERWAESWQWSMTWTESGSGIRI